MLVKLYLDDIADTDLILAIGAMPRGERSTRTKTLLRLALAGTGGLLVRVEALERRMGALEPKSHADTPAPTPPASWGADAMTSLLDGLD